MPRMLKIAMLVLCLLAGGNRLWAQVKGESGLKWYSWNASGGFMLPVDPFTPNLWELIERRMHEAATSFGAPAPKG